MAESLTEPVAQAQASRLVAEAELHKRLSQFHRREAAQARKKLDELRRRCAEFGIEFVFIGTDGGHSHDNADPNSSRSHD